MGVCTRALDAAYPCDTAIEVILDNHSAHVSRETNEWLAEQRDGRFTFVFTPRHGSWLNLVEGFFSKMARSVLRRIRVPQKPNSSRESWHTLTNSTVNPLSTPGPTESPRQRDRSRFMETLY
jgi:hypothetical protein